MGNDYEQTINGITYIARTPLDQPDPCTGCAFKDRHYRCLAHTSITCVSDERADNAEVIWVEKKPYEDDGMAGLVILLVVAVAVIIALAKVLTPAGALLL